MTKLMRLFAGRAVRAGGSDDAESALFGLIAAMADELVDAKNLVALTKKEEGRLAKQSEVAARLAEQWRQRATSALRAGDDVVAKDALTQRRQHERTAEAFRTAQQEHRREIERATAALSDRSLRVEEAKHKVNSLLLRAKRCRAESWLAAEARGAEREPPLELL